MNGQQTAIELHANTFPDDELQTRNNSTGCIILNQQTWEHFENLPEGTLFKFALILPNAFTSPSDVFETTTSNGVLQIGSPRVQARTFLESNSGQIDLFTENLVAEGALYTDAHTGFRSFPLIRSEWYDGKFENASAAANEFNRNIPHTLRPGDHVALLADGIISINDQTGYSYSTLGYGSGTCWTVAALDQTLLAVNVALPNGLSVPLVVYEEGFRFRHPHTYFTYGSFDSDGNRFPSYGATVYMNQTIDRRPILEGSKDYQFIINPQLEEYGIEGVSIQILPNNNVAPSINVQVGLVGAPENVTLEMRNFHSSDEIENAYFSRLISQDQHVSQNAEPQLSSGNVDQGSWDSSTTFSAWAQTSDAPEAIRRLNAFGRQVVQRYIRDENGQEDRSKLDEGIAFFYFAFPTGEESSPRTPIQQDVINALYGGSGVELVELWTPPQDIAASQ